MLIQVSVKNYKSFNELNSLNMIASNKLRTQKDKLYETVDITLLKSVVIYGANASGKSNFVDVLQFMKDCVLNQEIPVESYNMYCRNHRENIENISSFAVRLLLEKDCYEYGFDVVLNSQRIKDEWIIHLNHNKVLYQRLIIEDKLNTFLFSVGKEAEEKVKSLINELAEKDKDLNENLKEENQLLWVQKMNNYKNIAEEIVLKELIFNEKV